MKVVKNRMSELAVSPDNKLTLTIKNLQNCFNTSNSLSVKITNSHNVLFLLIHHFLQTTSYNIHNPSSQAQTTLGCA